MDTHQPEGLLQLQALYLLGLLKHSNRHGNVEPPMQVTSAASGLLQLKACGACGRDGGGQEEYALRVQLFAEIVPSESRWELLSTKVEVRLKKAAPGLWPRLEEAAGESAGSPPADAPAPESRPNYPSSSRRCVCMCTCACVCVGACVRA